MSPTVATVLTLLAYLCLGVVAVTVASVVGHYVLGALREEVKASGSAPNRARARSSSRSAAEGGRNPTRKLAACLERIGLVAGWRAYTRRVGDAPLLERRQHEQPNRRTDDGSQWHDDGLGDSESVPFGDRAAELRQSTRPGTPSRTGSRTRAERPRESPPGGRERGTVRAGRGIVTDDGIGLERTPRPVDGRDTLSYRAGIEWRMVAWTVDALYGDLAA